MNSEGELLSVVVPGAAEFVIRGPSPRTRHGHTPALAWTSVVHARAPEIALTVLAAPITGNGSVKTLPFLFEQTNYQFDLALENIGQHEPRLLLRGENLLLGRKRLGAGVYSVNVNFQSEVGYTDVELWIGSRRLFGLRLEVFPTKLDYRTDLLELRADLQMEVRSLVFELYGRTFQLLRRGARRRPADIDWLTLLRQEFEKLTHALDVIVRSPLQGIDVSHRVERSLRPARANVVVRDFLRKNAGRCIQAPHGHFSAGGRSWLTPQLPRVTKQLTPNTPENRFVAFAIGRMRSRLRRLLGQLAGVQKTQRFGSWSDFLVTTDRKLQHFQRQTFLKDVATTESQVAPTLALHLSPGYREFFSSWMALESLLEVSGGPLELPEKDLSTLYELWCFVALSSILRNELGLIPRPPTWLRVTQRRVALELVRGKTSVLSMEKNGQECLRVVYNRETTTPTGTFRPDNTLEILNQRGARTFRYVFDAKYRLQDDSAYLETNGAPGPPPDSINRMHAYRDQIVAELITANSDQNVTATVWDLGHRQWVQQTVGAFVLFPYAGADADKNRFAQSIAKVGVGGIPFLPSRRSEVTNLLKHILSKSPDAVEDTSVDLSTMEERRRIEWAHEYGLIAIVSSEEQLAYILESGIYHTPYAEHRKWGVRLRADFILFLLSESKFPGRSGIAYAGAVKAIHFGNRDEISPAPPQSVRGSDPTDRYIWFGLEKIEAVTPELKYRGQPPRFAFTTRLALKEATNVAELMLIREPERRLYQECRLAGLDVMIGEESPGADHVYDIAELRLRFAISEGAARRLTIRFDPWVARFQGVGINFSWRDLMFEPTVCVSKMFSVLRANDMTRDQQK